MYNRLNALLYITGTADFEFTFPIETMREVQQESCSVLAKLGLSYRNIYTKSMKCLRRQ